MRFFKGGSLQKACCHVANGCKEQLLGAPRAEASRMLIRNASELIKGSALTLRARRTALELLEAGLAAVDPHRLVQRALTRRDRFLHLDDMKIALERQTPIYVVGAGKATGRMAEATESILKDQLTDGLVIVPRGTEHDFDLKRIRVAGGGHPVPTREGCRATQAMLDLVTHAPAEALILCLVSGGGSALTALPTPPVTLEDLQVTYKLLVQSGASIEVANTVRKHLSLFAGGQLALAAYPRRVWSLLISDIPHERLDVIAAGPTLPDPSSFADAAQTLHQFSLWDKVPSRVRQHIENGVSGRQRETLKPSNPVFQRVVNRLVGSNRDACEAIRRAARQHGFVACLLTTDCQGEAREVGAKLARVALKAHDAARDAAQVVIIGSETTVTVRHPGKGGRNSELVTAAMKHLQDCPGLVVASLATDGIDGPTECAGAIIDETSYSRAQQLHYSPEDALDRNATYFLIQALGDHILTGPTHTNVRDVTVIVAMKQPGAKPSLANSEGDADN
jgi:hydroxypyruvate reductase